jgi:hypothetical protein
MSQENVEVVRRFLLLEVDEALTYVDPDIVWNPAEESATQGHDAVRASLVRWKSEWDDYELLPGHACTAGPHDAVVDSANQVTESSESNNTAHIDSICLL